MLIKMHRRLNGSVVLTLVIKLLCYLPGEWVAGKEGTVWGGHQPLPLKLPPAFQSWGKWQGH